MLEQLSMMFEGEMPSAQIWVIKTTSHRAREKMTRILGKRQAYYSWNREGEFYRVTPKEFEALKGIKGLHKSRDGNDLCPCWSMY